MKSVRRNAVRDDGGNEYLHITSLSPVEPQRTKAFCEAQREVGIEHAGGRRRAEEGVSRCLVVLHILYQRATTNFSYRIYIH